MVTVTLFSIFLNLVTCLFLSIFLIVTRNKYKSFTLFNVNLVLWSLCYALYIISDNPEQALIYTRFCSFFIVFIPYLAFNFCKELANYKVTKSAKKINLICAILLAALMHTPYLIKGVKPFMSFKFIPDITLLYYLLPVYYTVNVVYGHIILYKTIKTDSKNRFIFTGFLIGFAGGTTNLLPYMGIPLYPVGNFLISIYCPLVTYAIIKHRLFDISIVVSEGIARILTVMTLTVIYFFTLYLYNILIPAKSTLTNNVFNIAFLFIALESYNFLMRKFQSLNSHIIAKNSYQYEDSLKTINRELTSITDIEVVWNKMAQIFKDKLQIKISSFAVVIDDSNLKFFGEDLSDVLPSNFIEQIKNFGYSLTYEEAPSWLKTIFKNDRAYCFIPFLSEKRAVGFMMVKRESAKGNFSYNDLVLFDHIIFQVGIIVDRVEVYRKFSLQKQKFLEDKATSLKSLAGTIAHEIRNPLNTINFTQNQIKSLLQKDNAPDQNQQKLISLVSAISDSVNQAHNIINIILNDLKEKPIDPSEFAYLNSTKIINEIINNYGYKDESQKQRIKLKLENEFMFKAVADRFVFIIYNLLKNAIHYFDQYPDSIITIGTEVPKALDNNSSCKVTVDDHELDLSNYNIIYVYDTGPGISSEVLPRLFHDFFTSGKKDGTGLGLSFCKRNMIAFGGNIICESEPNKYTKFSLLFPKVTEEDLLKSSDLNKLRILVVDDQRNNLVAAKTGIEHNLPDIICDTTLSGQRAITLIKENNYCLVLMDINMPEMNGVETAIKIREFNKDLPIIAHTSMNYEEFLTFVKDSKGIFNDYITKPIPNNGSYRTVTKWITNYKDEMLYITDEEYRASFKNNRIIIADDQESNLLIVAKTLELLHAEIVTVKNGTELLEAYKQSLDQNNNSSFNLIITDLNMPGLSGDKAVEEIRKNNSKTPIIILSGDGSQKDIYNFFKFGATDYFIKGNQPELLMKIIANYLVNRL